jgi:2-oxoglutarate dehydrogenase E2 component (dihydrolipoamide succinyltransferase)
MKTEVVMPQMGESVAEGTVTKWLKEVGERVERDEPLFELTTDKVDADVPSPVEGVLVEIRAEPGDTVEVNSIVAVIDTEAEEGEAVETAPAAAAAEETAAEPSAPAEAVTTSGERPSRKKTNGSTGGLSLAAAPPADASVDELRRTRSTPLVRKIAEEHGIEDLSPIPGSGISGRVRKRDILEWIEQGKHETVGTRPSRPTPDAHLPDIEIGPRDRVELMSPQRQMIARHIIASRQTSAHAQTIHEIDFTNVVEARKQLKPDFARRDVRLTYTAFLMKAAAQALVDFPVLNSSVDGDHIVYRGDLNLGVAVDTGDSLIVPVIENVDELSLLGVARAVNDVSTRARDKKLKPDEVKGGTFTISNPGIFGSEFGIPIINQPQTAILVTGAIKKRVVVDQATDAIMVRPTSIWCLSFDHRVIDGATADKFMRRMREIIENWTV